MTNHRSIGNFANTKVRFVALLLFVAAQCAVFTGLATRADAASSIAQPVFSVKHGFKNAPFALALSSSTSGASIRYTTNGATPTTSSGTLYTTPLTISATTPVRAIAYKSSSKSTVLTQTYIFTSQVRSQSNTPSGYPTMFAKNDANGPYPADYAMDPEITNSPNYRDAIEPALTSLPSISLTTDIANLFSTSTGIYYNPALKGSGSERPTSVEWIDPNGGNDFSENAGIRIHGETSRLPQSQPKKSFRLYFDSDYGKAALGFNLFPSNGEAIAPKSSFTQLILRNGGNRSWPYSDSSQRRETDYVNDQWARDAYLAMGRFTAHGNYVNLYLNGMYWGLYNIAERPGAATLVTYFGGKESDYDFVAADEEVGNIPVADSGTIDAYNKVMKLVAGTAPISASTYNTLKAQVDVADLADYMILNHYIGKTDWPNHNWYTYRKRSGSDTRFKFIAWDNDSGLNNINENITLADEVNKPAHLFLRLTSNAEFRQLLTDRLNIALGTNGALSETACTARYTRLTNKISSAVIAESARWGDYSRDVYQWTNAPANAQGPAYLYSRDLADAESDPQQLVDDALQKSWVEVRDEKLSNYCPNRGTILRAQYTANGWDTGTAPPVDPTTTTTTTSTTSTTTTTTRPASTTTTTTTRPVSTTTTTTTVPPTTTGSFREVNGEVVVEAESATVVARKSKTWTDTTSLAGFGGRGARTATPNKGTRVDSNITSESPSLDMSLAISTPGTYNVWVRAAGPTTSDDSVYVGRNNVPGPAVTVWDKNWIWANGGTVNLTAGTNNFSIWMREDGVIVDRVVLTQSGVMPTGIGPAESVRNP